MRQFEFQWSNLDSAVDEETIERWWKNPFYRRVCIFGFFIYEIVRALITTIAAIITAFIFLRIIVIFGGAGNEGLLLESVDTGITLTTVYPDGYKPITVLMFGLIFTSAIIVLFLEEMVDEHLPIHRPLSLVSLHIVYLLVLISANFYSLVRRGRFYDKKKLSTFKKEILIESPGIKIIFLHYLQSNIK